MELPICECATVWPGQGHHPECPVRRKIERFRTALAAATERAERLAGLLDYEVKAHNDTRRKLCSAEGGEALYKRMAEQAEARADALAARLAEVEGRT